MNNLKAVFYVLLACTTAALAVRGLPSLPDPFQGLACLATGALTGFPALVQAFVHLDLDALQKRVPS